MFGTTICFSHIALMGLDISNGGLEFIARVVANPKKKKKKKKGFSKTYQNCRKLDPILSSSSGAGIDLALVPLFGIFERPRFLEIGRGTRVVVVLVVVVVVFVVVVVAALNVFLIA